ncbi:zinc finger and SCAN domain-containing protein 2-like [Drosophila subpulchrella]|uniref:zinc finger and SCAN domain-containing protein 2-like n=1 Tax=Drosophila subpulchrella TaxID=1486046 RepID=UPI0018A1962F|nr:zinc finger and SCAN domain-containing protein 2-like [Drosophila subpulchrella]
MESLICRVCKLSDENMINIFDDVKESRVSIATLVFQWSGHQVEKDDLLPKTICRSCLQDAQKAYERNHELIDDPLDNIVGVLANCHDEVSNSVQVKEELLQAEIEPPEEKFPCHVKNEPLEEEPLSEEQYCATFETDFNQFDSLVKIEHNLLGEDQDVDCQPGINDDDNEDYEPAITDGKNEDYEWGIDDADDEDYEPVDDADYEPNGNDQTDNERPHKCPYCPKSFTNKSGLGPHLKTHNGERPFKCTHCARTFTRSTNLRRHLLTHSAERPFRCSLCSKSFQFKQYVRDHMRIHSDERPVLPLLKVFYPALQS